MSSSFIKALKTESSKTTQRLKRFNLK